MSTRLVTARVPDQLADAVEARAEAAGITTSDVMRAALVREVVSPVDNMSRAFVELWLAGAINDLEQHR